MSAITKVELKKQLEKYGITVNGNYVLKKDIEKVLATAEKWMIIDWAGNIMFKGETWPSFDDAEEFLCEKLDEKYDTDRGEYEIVPVPKKATSKYKATVASAMPSDIKSIWDNEGDSLDRYTVVLKYEWSPGELAMLGLSKNPDHPQGFSQFSGGQEGSHLGTKIKWEDLPENVQQHVIKRLAK